MELIRRTRELAEAQERELLGRSATLSSESKGRDRAEDPDPYRTAFERDRDRITHSLAFRRLKHKTQVFINPDDDHFVTRMSHTIQVTQIGRSMARFLSLNEALTEAICLGHDVGHAPFGHVGEDALTDYIEREWLHSQQALRIFEFIEPMNLTWEVRDGIRAHSWKIEPGPANPEGMLCRFADRIAYLTHDVLDAERAGLIRFDQLPGSALARFGDPGSPWIAAMIEAVIEESLTRGQVAMESSVLEAMHELRDFMFKNVYLRAEAKPQKERVSRIVHDLMDHYLSHVDELPEFFRSYEAADLNRVLDYVSGMTDRYAIRIHAELGFE